MDNNCVKYYQDPTWQWGVISRTRILGICAQWTFYLIVQGFHRTYATGAACQQRTLTPPDTWSCPTLGRDQSLLNLSCLRTFEFWTSLGTSLLHNTLGQGNNIPLGHGQYACEIYWTRKERYHFGDVTFLSSRWKWIYMGYEILLTTILFIGLCHKFRDQSSVKGLSRQWVEFQKSVLGEY